MNFSALKQGYGKAVRAGLIFVTIVLFIAPFCYAQKRRPKILPPQNGQFAGKLLLLPRDGRPISWQLPRLVARVADYEIVFPPRELLGDFAKPMDADGIIAWAKKLDYDQINGVIVSLDGLTGIASNATPEQITPRLEFINWLRQRKAELPIYGFVQKPNDEISKLVFDDLLLNAENPDVAHLLVARFLNRINQRPPKIMPIASAEYAPEMLTALKRQIAAVGGQFVASGKADIFLFIHTPNTDETKLTNFNDALARTLASGYYVALADVSGQADTLISKLRAGKKLDLLQTYAASKAPDEAFGKALAHISMRLIAAKVLRKNLDVEQLRRPERAHVELLLTRYLEDWGYAEIVRPKIEGYIREQLKVEPNKLGDGTAQAAEFVRFEIQQLAEELFTQQFKNNVHSILLENGFRAHFQVAILQRLRVRLPLQRTDEIELEIGIHLPLLVGFEGITRRP